MKWRPPRKVDGCPHKFWWGAVPKSSPPPKKKEEEEEQEEKCCLRGQQASLRPFGLEIRTTGSTQAPSLPIQVERNSGVFEPASFKRFHVIKIQIELGSAKCIRSAVLLSFAGL